MSLPIFVAEEVPGRQHQRRAPEMLILRIDWDLIYGRNLTREGAN